jgi:GTP cyclohydrolase I
MSLNQPIWTNLRPRFANISPDRLFPAVKEKQGVTDQLPGTQLVPPMRDIQSLHDSRRINIRKVGVKTITYPIIVLDKECKTQQTVAKVNMYVNLPHRFKGTHMSRFVEILNRFHGKFNIETFHLILEEMKVRLEAEAAHLEIEFPYFLTSGRVAQSPGMERYDCRLHGSLSRQLDLVVEVDVPVPLPYPAIAPASAAVFSGLWGMVTVAVRMNRFLWIEDLIALIKEGAVPQPTYPDGVESMCRRISSVLRASGAFHWYKVVVKNIASGYSAFASIEWPEPAENHAEGLNDCQFTGAATGPEVVSTS